MCPSSPGTDTGPGFPVLGPGTVLELLGPSRAPCPRFCSLLTPPTAAPPLAVLPRPVVANGAGDVGLGARVGDATVLLFNLESPALANAAAAAPYAPPPPRMWRMFVSLNWTGHRVDGC